MRRIAGQHGAKRWPSVILPFDDRDRQFRRLHQRLMNAFGTPNLVSTLDVCGWGRGFATRYTFGVGSVATGSGGGAMADIAEAGA